MSTRYFPAIFLLFCCVPGLLRAQELRVRIAVTNDSLQGLSGARLQLTPDRGKALLGKTDSSGSAEFLLQAGAAYVVEIAAKGHADATDNLVPDSAHTSFSYRLSPSNTLQGAVVTASRPLMRQDGDVTIVDPEPLADASTSGYEVLEKTPGIIADQDGNFYMTSTTPATVYINGRQMKMSNADIAAMLKSLPPNSIQRIEIMRTPSSKFDASGSGGIINIVLKKGIKVGLTGSVNLSLQQGIYGNQTGGVNLSYNDGGRSAYLNVNAASRRSLENIRSSRRLNADSLLSQEAETVYRTGNLFLGYGASTTLREKWDLSYDGRLSRSSNDNTSGNVSGFAVPGDVLRGVNTTGTRNYGSSWNIDQSFDLKYKIDSNGSEWVTLGSWNGNFADGRQDIRSAFAERPQTPITDDGTIDTRRHYFSLQSDLKYRWRHELTFETGLKSSLSSFRHHSDFDLSIGGGAPIEDPLRSTRYNYSENINAAYFQVTKKFGAITVKPGLRLENTNMTGEQTYPGTSDFRIRRTDLFPYLYISRKVMSIAKYELRAYLVYRKTIQRPSYDYLNPFQRFIDQYLYETGNPKLRPQFTHNYEANVSIDERPVLAVGYNKVDDIFANVVYQSEADPTLALRTWDNLGANREFYVRGFGAIPPGGTYFFVLGGQYNLNDYDGFYNGERLQYRRETWTVFTYHNLKLGKRSNLMVHGFMRLRGMVQFYEVGTFGSLNASINRNFFNRKLTVTLSAQDLFFTNKYDATINRGGIDGEVFRYNDSRRYQLSLRYNFGIKRKEEHRGFMGEEDGQERP